MWFALNYSEMLIIRDGAYSSYQTYQIRSFCFGTLPSSLTEAKSKNSCEDLL